LARIPDLNVPMARSARLRRQTVAHLSPIVAASGGLL